MRTMSEEHKVIWLEPSCGEENNEGRQWCQDNVWSDTCDGCEAKPVKFIRADLVEERRAALDATHKMISEGGARWVSADRRNVG